MSNSHFSADQYIERALRDYPKTRDDDKKLILCVWWLQDNNYDEDFPRFFMEKAIHPETITRGRRKLQELGHYRATPKVEEARYEKFKKVKEVAPRANNAQQILSIFGE